MPLNAFDGGADALGPFLRFQWVLPGVVARSSQPGYNGNADTPHGMGDADVAALTAASIKTVISANAFAINDASKGRLSAAGIGYYHFPVEDFHPHTTRQLEEASRLIRAHPAALVYCGYGQGRTGTLVAGWAITSRQAGVQQEDGYLRNTFGVETDEQIAVLLRL